MTSQAALRVGDSEREAAISLLATHFADGRLTQVEHEERMALALSARTGADLDILFADLPRVALQAAAAVRRPSPLLRPVRRFAPFQVVQPLIGVAMVLVGLFVVLHLLPVIALVVVVFVVSRILFGSRRGWHG